MSVEEKNINEELQNLDCTILVQLRSINPYKFPEKSYFTNNLEVIMDRGLLLPYAYKGLQEIPENYFVELIDNVSERIADENRDTEPTFSFEKQKIENPYQVPNAYFEQLRPDFLDREEAIFQKKEKAKLVSLLQNINKYVAAAVVLVIFSIGANIMLHIKEQKKAFQLLNNMDIKNELADVPTEEIFNYLNQSSSKNMDYLINPKGDNYVDKVISSQQHNDKKLTNDASDEEILEFLSDEDHGF